MNISKLEQEFAPLVEALNRRVAGQDAATRARLVAIREQAQRQRVRLPWLWQPRLLWLVPLATTVAIIVLVLAAHPNAQVPPAPVASPETFMLLASQDLAPLEDLDLYVWLERNTDAL